MYFFLTVLKRNTPSRGESSAETLRYQPPTRAGSLFLDFATLPPVASPLQRLSGTTNPQPSNPDLNPQTLISKFNYIKSVPGFNLFFSEKGNKRTAG